MSANERRPAGAASEAWRPAPSVPSAPVPVTDDTAAMAEAYTFDLTRMTVAARALWLEVYGLGYRDGIEAGRRQVEAELAAEWAALRAEVMPRLRTAIPFATACERRGDPIRATRQVALLRANGVTP